MIASLVAVSFQEGSGSTSSLAADAAVSFEFVVSLHAINTNKISRMLAIFFIMIFLS
jgi:hypothetical protein